MIKFLWLMILCSSLLLLTGCSGGSGGKSNQTGNRGGPKDSDGGGFILGGEFLAEHDGDGVNAPNPTILADDVGLSPTTVLEGCFPTTSCELLGMLVKYSPTLSFVTPFTIRSVSYYVLGPLTAPCATAGGSASITADFVVYEAGADTPGTEILRVALTLDQLGLGPAEATSPPTLKTFTFSPPLVITDLLLGAADGTFFAGVEFANTSADPAFNIIADTDPTPFPDPDGPWVAADPYPGPPVCPTLIPPSTPSSGFVLDTSCLEPGTFGSGRGTSFSKCGASAYAMAVSAVTPFPPSFDWILTVEIGP